MISSFVSTLRFAKLFYTYTASCIHSNVFLLEARESAISSSSNCKRSWRQLAYQSANLFNPNIHIDSLKICNRWIEWLRLVASTGISIYSIPRTTKAICTLVILYVLCLSFQYVWPSQQINNRKV